MSRYRRSDYNMPYGDGPSQRWDSDRYQRESQFRGPPVMEQRPPYADYGRGPGRAPVYEDERYYEQDRYGPGGYSERRYFEEDDYYDPRAGGGAMVPFRPERPSRVGAPGRPSMIRRQSSLDRIEFDRRRSTRYHDDYRPPPRRPSPRRNSRYADIQVQDPYYYGDDGFREYREREWVRSRTRDSSPSPDTRGPVETRTEIVKEEKDLVVEKPYPRRGKTRMPKRLVHTKVLFDLGYPYYEENDRTIIIEKALGPENIDEIFAKSKEYRETTTTRLLEAPPTINEPSGNIVEETKIEEIRTKSLAEAPRSVRDWDQMSGSRRSRSHVSRSRRGSSPNGTFIERKSVVESGHSPKSRRSRSRVSRRSSSSGDRRETIIRKETIIERDSSPASHHHTHRASSVGGTEVIERKIIETDDIDESNSIHVGPLALVDRTRSRTDRDIKDEIRRLEHERRALRRERRYERESLGGTEIIKIERERRDSSPGVGILRETSPRGEVIIERHGDELVEVRKDRRARSRSRPPSANLLKGMMYTVT